MSKSTLRVTVNVNKGKSFKGSSKGSPAFRSDVRCNARCEKKTPTKSNCKKSKQLPSPFKSFFTRNGCIRKQPDIYDEYWNLSKSFKRGKLIEFANQVAEQLAMSNPLRICSVDQLEAALLQSGQKQRTIGNSINNIFRANNWEATGIRVRRPRNGKSRRQVMVYRLVENPCTRTTTGYPVLDWMLSCRLSRKDIEQVSSYLKRQIRIDISG